MKRAALCVGANRYLDPGINPLEFAEADATELYAFFKRSAGYEDVRHLVAPEADQVLDCAREMVAGLEAVDLFVFFFAGHGYEFHGRHLLLCPKARLSRLQFFHQTVPVDLLKEETQLHGVDRAFVLDVCRTDLLKGRGGPSGLLGAQGLRDIVTTPSVGEGGAFALLCVCDEGQQARELPDLRQGLFSRALIEELEAAAQAGAEFKLDDRCESELRGRMGRLASRYDIPAGQRPWIERSGRIPVLLGGRVTVTTEGESGALRSSLAIQHAGRVLCPMCGLRNEPDETFRCQVCGRDYLCRSHFVESQWCCQECEKTTPEEVRTEGHTGQQADRQAELCQDREEGTEVARPGKTEEMTETPQEKEATEASLSTASTVADLTGSELAESKAMQEPSAQSKAAQEMAEKYAVSLGDIEVIEQKTRRILGAGHWFLGICSVLGGLAAIAYGYHFAGGFLNATFPDSGLGFRVVSPNDYPGFAG